MATKNANPHVSELQFAETKAPEHQTPALDLKKIVVLNKSLKDRDDLYAHFKNETGLHADFISDLDKAIETLTRTRIGYFFHCWDEFDSIQNHKLHQRIAKMSELAPVCRMIYTKKINVQILALATDVQIDRVFSEAKFKLNLGEEMHGIKYMRENTTPIQESLLAIYQKRCDYDQKTLDKVVAESFDQFPQDPVVQLEFGNLCYRKGELLKAENIANSLLKKDPHNVRALSLVSRILMKNGQLDEAFQVLEQANFLSPKNTDRLIQLGEVFYRRNETDKARSFLQEAVNADPSDINGIEAYAKFEIREENYKEALDLFKSCLSEEEAAGSLNTAGIRSAKDESFGSALNLYGLAMKSLHSDTYKPILYFNIGLALKYMKKYSDAANAFDMAVKLDPDFTKAKRQQGLVRRIMANKAKKK